MSIESLLFNIGASRSDKKRDAAIPIPGGVAEHRNIRYSGKLLLDVYYPEGTAERLPTIVSIHGGGYIYGNKEIYRRYCMDLAKRGFSVVNFNYRLAPRWKFPAPLEDTNRVMEWICENAEKYHMDTERIFVVGDSAGAQLASQYGAIWSNPEYAKLFAFEVPHIHIRGLGLNCGMYDCKEMTAKPRKGMAKDYLPRKIGEDDLRLDVLSAVTDQFPPSHITTAYHDFLRQNAEPMCAFLQRRNVNAVWEIYGEGNESIGHVFHVNILLPEAIACNDSQAAFFKAQL